MTTALVRREDTPQAWKSWCDYRMDRDRARLRLVFWPDNLPLYPYGRCPAKEDFGTELWSRHYPNAILRHSTATLTGITGP